MRVPNISDRQVVLFNQDFVDPKAQCVGCSACCRMQESFCHVIRVFLWLVILFIIGGVLIAVCKENGFLVSH